MKNLSYVAWKAVGILGVPYGWVDSLFAPKAPELAQAERERRAKLVAGHTLYHFEGSPYCRMVRHKMISLGLDIPLANTLLDDQACEDLVRLGGNDQVPCLRIESAGQPARWMYESGAISEYLEGLCRK